MLSTNNFEVTVKFMIQKGNMWDLWKEINDCHLLHPIYSIDIKHRDTIYYDENIKENQ